MSETSIRIVERALEVNPSDRSSLVDFVALSTDPERVADALDRSGFEFREQVAVLLDGLGVRRSGSDTLAFESGSFALTLSDTALEVARKGVRVSYAAPTIRLLFSLFRDPDRLAEEGPDENRRRAFVAGLEKAGAVFAPHPDLSFRWGGVDVRAAWLPAAGPNPSAVRLSWWRHPGIRLRFPLSEELRKADYYTPGDLLAVVRRGIAPVSRHPRTAEEFLRDLMELLGLRDDRGSTFFPWPWTTFQFRAGYRLRPLLLPRMEPKSAILTFEPDLQTPARLRGRTAAGETVRFGPFASAFEMVSEVAADRNLENEEDRLLEATALHPENDEPRLAWARWREARDPNDACAGIVRAQIALDSHPAEARFASPIVTEAEYLAEKARVEARKEHQTRAAKLDEPSWNWWRGRVSCGWTEIQFRRGAPMKVGIPAPTLLEHGDELFAAAPIVFLRLYDIRLAGIERVFRDPLLSRLWALDLQNGQLGDAGIAALASGPVWPNLCWLQLSANQIGPEGWRALARSRRFPALRWVGVDHNAQPESPPWSVDPCGPDPLEIPPHLAGPKRIVTSPAILLPAVVRGFFGRVALVDLRGESRREERTVVIDPEWNDPRPGDRIEVMLDWRTRFGRLLGRGPCENPKGDESPGFAPSHPDPLRGRVRGFHSDQVLVALDDGTKVAAHWVGDRLRSGDAVDVLSEGSATGVIRALVRHPDAATALSPDGERLLIADPDGTLTIWRDFGEKVSLERAIPAPASVAWPGAILVLDREGTLFELNPETFVERRRIRLTTSGTLYAGGDRFLVAAAESIEAWGSAGRLGRLDMAVSRAAMTSNGRAAVLFAPREKQLLLLDLDTMEASRSQGFSNVAGVAARDSDRSVVATETGEVFVWDFARQAKRAVVAAANERCHPALRSDGRVAAILTASGKVSFVDVESGKEISRSWVTPLDSSMEGDPFEVPLPIRTPPAVHLAGKRLVVVGLGEIQAWRFP